MQSLKFSAPSRGLTMVHADNKGIIDGLWTGEMKFIGPKAKDADL